VAQAGDPGVLAPAVARERSWLMPLPGGAPPGASRDTRTLSRRARRPRPRSVLSSRVHAPAGLSQADHPATRTWEVSKTEGIKAAAPSVSIGNDAPTCEISI